MKKLFGLLSLVLIAGMLLAACAPAATPAPTQAPAPTAAPTKAPEATKAPEPTKAPEDPVAKIDPKGAEILFWHASTKTHEEVLKKLVEQFNTTNEWGIKVKAEFGGAYNDLYKKVLAAITAGETPDLAVAYQNQVAVYAQNGVVTTLDDYIASPKYGLTAKDKEDIFASFLNADKYPEYGNKMLSYPPSRSMLVMFYNVDLLKKLGYDGTPPETWDKFAEMCQKATEAGAKGFAIYEMTSSLSNMIFSRGGDVISADGKKATFNSAAGVESLKLVQDLVKKGYAYQVAEAYGDQTDFTAGKVLFTFGSSAGLPYYRSGIKDSKAPFEWGVAAMPHGAQVKQAVVDIYGPSICVFKTKPEKQLAAWLFLRWFTQTEQTSQWAQVANYFPMRKSALETESFKAFLAKEPNYSKALALLPQGKGEPTISAWSDIRGFMADAYTAVINGEDPQKALDAAATKADAKLAGK